MKHIFNTNSWLTRSAAWMLGLSMAGGFSSCSDFLELEPQDIVTLEQFWNEEKDVENSIAGCYACLSDYHCLSRMMIWGEFRSENIATTGPIQKDGSLERIMNENLEANNAYTSWTCFYDIINRCNIILHYAPQVAAKDPGYTPEELAAHKAEVVALRSLCYFYLIRTFRDVPYNLEAYMDDEQVMDLPQTGFYEILDNLIASLEEVKNSAVKYYPSSTINYAAGYSYQKSRITQCAIYAMLCEMYLWKGDYDNCIKYADLIADFKKEYVKNYYTNVDYSDFYGYPIVRSRNKNSMICGRAFQEIFVENDSRESIFEIGYDKTDTDGKKICNGPVGNFFGTDGNSGWVVPGDGVKADAKLGNTDGLFKAQDGRRYENFDYDSKGNISGINKHTIRNSFSLYYQSNPDGYYSYLGGIKYPFKAEGSEKISRNKSNWIIYRLTDIMLLKAEALCQQIDESEDADYVQNETKMWEAFKLCNAVNKRASYAENYSDSLVYGDYRTKESLMNLVMEERQRELMFEGKRWFDMVRYTMREYKNNPGGEYMKYIKENAAKKSTKLKEFIDMRLRRIDAIFWPINLSEIKANSNLKQNPSFNSGEGGSYEKN